MISFFSRTFEDELKPNPGNSSQDAFTCHYTIRALAAKNAKVFFSYTYCRANDKMKANREQTRVKLINRKPETTFKVQVLLM